MGNKRTPLYPRFQGQMAAGVPHRMAKIKMSHAERELFEGQALDIFTECSNSGLPFRSCLLAILVSGMDWGVQATKKP